MPVKRSQRRRAARACALASALVAEAGAAQTTPVVEAHFELRGPEGCNSAEDFAAHVRKRSSRISLVSSPSSRSLLVELQEQPKGTMRGSFKVIEADGKTRGRQLDAASCAEAVEALSLIVTVTLDPDALLEEPTQPEPPAPKPAPAPATPKTRPTPPKPVPALEAERARYRLSFGVGAALLVNQAPQVAPGGAAAVALEVNAGEVWSPFFRLSVVHAQRRNIQEPGGDANFAFTVPTLDVCPVRFGPRALGIRPCAFGSAGLLEVWGSAAARTESHARAIGAAGGAIWLGARVSEVFEITADGRVGAAFRRDRFGFDDRGFFTTPTLGFSAGLGVAGGFP